MTQKQRAAAEKGALFSDGPKAQHPKVNTDGCIGCGACITVCPEGDVLALVSGKATIINGHKCIGHGLCAEACPVGAITMVMAKASSGADIPVLNEEHETNVENLFITGELGGLALIKNAVNQGRDCVDTIARRFGDTPAPPAGTDVLDLVIVGAGPAGISASLRASEHKLKTVTLEREDVGGTVSKYPRQKLVMTSPVEFPLYGKFSKTALSKEDLLAFWQKVMKRTDLDIHTSEPVNTVKKGPDGLFQINTPVHEYKARAVVLALGRAGTPRKLGVKGEELPTSTTGSSRQTTTQTKTFSSWAVEIAPSRPQWALRTRRATRSLSLTARPSSAASKTATPSGLKNTCVPESLMCCSIPFPLSFVKAACRSKSPERSLNSPTISSGFSLVALRPRTF